MSTETSPASGGGAPGKHNGHSLKFMAHRLSFSKHSLAKQSPASNFSNLSQSLRQQPTSSDGSIHRSETSKRRLETPIIQTNLSEPYDPEDLVDSDSSSDDEEVKKKREEDAKDYRAGGYHPTATGERYGRDSEYLIVRKLGWGHFSTVWLAWDSTHSRHVAIKIVRSSKSYTEAAKDEIRILEKVNDGPADHPGKRHIVQLLDHFIHKGPNGDHVCMVFEVLGENMLALLLRYKKFQRVKTHQLQRSTTANESKPNSSDLSTSSRGSSVEYHMSTLNDLTILRESYGGLPLTLICQISKQILLALDYLHRECGIIHTDLKPENVLVEIHDVEKLVRTLEIDRRRRRTEHQVGRPGARRSVCDNIKIPSPRLTRTPVRTSKPLTTPVETSTSVDNFFRSFSLGRPRSHTLQSFSPIEVRQNGFRTLPEEKEEKEQEQEQEVHKTLSIEEEDNDEFVDADELPHTSSKLASATPSPGTSVTKDYIVPPPIGLNESVNDPLLRQNSIMSCTSSHSILNDLDGVISVKIADLGNACWSDLHYTNDIETRQYRAPEIILGGKWGCSTDLWSCACLIFELITGDYLFDPKSGSTYDKNDDHLAQMIELLQAWPPKEYLKKCKYSRDYFDKSYQALRNINKLKIWTMPEVLQEEYRVEKPLAEQISHFLLSMLEFEPAKRVDAGSMSNHPWLVDSLDETIDRPFGLRGKDINGYASENKAKKDCTDEFNVLGLQEE